MGFEGPKTFFAEQEQTPKTEGSFESVPEKAREDFLKLGALQWMGKEGERAFHEKPYEETRNILKHMDYTELLPLATQLKQQYKEEYQDKYVGESFVKNIENKVLKQVQEDAKALHARPLAENQFAFGKGLQSEDVLRVYLAPKLDKDNLPNAISRITSALNGLDANIKINNADWFNKTDAIVGSEKGMQRSSYMNRIVVYLERKSPNTNIFLQRLAADKDLLKRLEDSGEWAATSRVPIARGISIVEGSTKGWDMSEGKHYTAFRERLQTGRWPDWDIEPSKGWFNKPAVQEALKTKSLEPLGRVTKMLALKAD